MRCHLDYVFTVLGMFNVGAAGANIRLIGGGKTGP